MVGRVGGDEFLVFIQDIPNFELVKKKADALVNLLRYKPNMTIPSSVTISIGVAFYETDMSYEELFQHADEAMYVAKTGGKARYSI